MGRQHEPECAMEAEVIRWNWLAEKVVLYRETPRQPEGAPDILNRPGESVCIRLSKGAIISQRTEL